MIWHLHPLRSQFLPIITEDPSTEVVNFCRSPHWYLEWVCLVSVLVIEDFSDSGGRLEDRSHITHLAVDLCSRSICDADVPELDYASGKWTLQDYVTRWSYLSSQQEILYTLLLSGRKNWFRVLFAKVCSDASLGVSMQLICHSATWEVHQK